MKTFFMLLSIMFLTSCPNMEIYDTSCNTDNPLEDLIWLKEIKQTIDRIDCAGNSKIIQYTYNENTVFEVNICEDIADGETVVYNCEGEIICVFGGFAGQNTCPDFYDTAIDRVILYGN